MHNQIIDGRDAVQLSVGSAAATFPIWDDWVALATGANQFLVGLLGLVVLGLTIHNLYLKNRILRRQARGEGRQVHRGD